MTGAIAAHTLQTDQVSTAWKLHLKENTFLVAPSLSRYLVLMALPVLFAPVVLVARFGLSPLLLLSFSSLTLVAACFV